MDLFIFGVIQRVNGNYKDFSSVLHAEARRNNPHRHIVSNCVGVSALACLLFKRWCMKRVIVNHTCLLQSASLNLGIFGCDYIRLYNTCDMMLLHDCNCAVNIISPVKAGHRKEPSIFCGSHIQIYNIISINQINEITDTGSDKRYKYLNNVRVDCRVYRCITFELRGCETRRTVWLKCIGGSFRHHKSIKNAI